MFYKITNTAGDVIGVVDNSGLEVSKFFDGSWTEYANIGAVAEGTGGDAVTIDQVEYDCLIAKMALPTPLVDVATPAPEVTGWAEPAQEATEAVEQAA